MSSHGSAFKTFESFRKLARKYRREGEENLVALLFLLAELEPQVVVWESVYPTWDGLLAGEGFCSATRYAKFVAAKRVFKREEFERLGLNCCLLVAALPASAREKVKPLVDEWWKSHQVPLTTQLTVGFIGQVSPRHALGSNAPTLALKKRVQRLEAVLMQHGITPPPPEDDAVSADESEKGTAIDASIALVRAKWRLKTLFPSLSDEDVVKVAIGFVNSSSESFKHALHVRPTDAPRVAGDRMVTVGGKKVRVVDALLDVFPKGRMRTSTLIDAIVDQRWVFDPPCRTREKIRMLVGDVIGTDPRFRRSVGRGTGAAFERV